MPPAPLRRVPFFLGTLLTATLALATTASVRAAPPAGSDEIAVLVGKPTALEVQPSPVALTGPRSVAQLVVTGRYADGTVRDLTQVAAVAADAPGLVEIADGFLRPKKNGSTSLIVRAGDLTVRVPLAVQKMDADEPVSFRHDVIAALNVGGCNAGACHGTPSGKNGFRLSLRGFDPALDYVQLTRDVFGRRSGPLSPGASLVLQKALGRVPHEGGARFQANSIPAGMLTAWLAEGSRNDAPTLPALSKITVLPGARVLRAPARSQQIAVLAHFADGTVRDVTRLTVFSSSDPGVADVSLTGHVEFKQAGEVAVLCRYLEELQAVRLTYLEPRPGFHWSDPPAVNYVDKLVFAKLKLMSLPPSDLCTDAEFLRRASLDLCGLMPTADEARAFLADKSPNKRAKLIDALLERPEYADFWALKWADVLRNNRKTLGLKGAMAFQNWLRGHVGRNTPFDAMARELLTGNGNTFTNPPANYYRVARDPQNLAETTAQLFMGARMQCAKCHNHPFERWTQDDYYSLAAFFARVRYKRDPLAPPPANKAAAPDVAEVVFADRAGEVVQPRTGKTMPPKFPGGAVAVVPTNRDRRDVLADWLTSAENPYFARSVANRVWYHLNGKGIVDPVDDFRDSNPSCNDDLLDALAKDFASHQFDTKHLIRSIMNSRTYQLSAQPNDYNKDDSKYFSHAVTKLLTAEQMLDALCDATAVPEKFKGLPAGTRAIQLPDGEVNHPFLKTFGQPARELACECERESDSNLAQALQLINGPTINEKIRDPNNRLGKLLTAKKSDKDVLEELYLTTLARPPLEDEVATALAHVAKSADKRKGWEDVLWALLNTREFLFRH